tara:strand:- start:2505 stop:2900 length:396 start_codon:yes stop_codon:yes gene_type:complete
MPKVTTAGLDERLKHVEREVLVLQDKKLSKHEKANIDQNITGLKDIFSKDIEKMHRELETTSKTTMENTMAINQIKSSLEDIDKTIIGVQKFLKDTFLPEIYSIAKNIFVGLGIIIIGLVTYIGGTILKLW